MDTLKDERTPHALLDRASRSTRGKRMNKLLDEEIEQDELFWNQEALNDAENDDNYAEEHEVADEFDSDFDDDEAEPDEEEDNTVHERKEKKKKRLLPPGSIKTKKKKKEKVISELEEVTEKPSDGQEHNDNEREEDKEKVVRKSTRTSVIVRQAEREAIRLSLQAIAKPIKRKKEGEEKRMTQEEMLLEAAQTEIRNLRNLERVLAREEEVKKKAVSSKQVYEGPQTRFFSTDGASYLEFKGGYSFESAIRGVASPYPEKAVCVVTGMPAKYRDPKTGLAYANKEAFRVIRERLVKEEEKRGMEMGWLFEALNGNGFVEKKKRSPAFMGRRTSCFLRFGIAPQIHIQDSD